MDICHECCLTIEKLNNEYDKLHEEKESYKKALFSQTKIDLAKKKLKEIYINPPGSRHNRSFNGWIDYPIVESCFGKNPLWDEFFDLHHGVSPTLKQIKEEKYGWDGYGIKKKKIPLGNVIEILDFAYSYKGSLSNGIIIYDKKIPEYRKLNLLKALNSQEADFIITFMKADNILNGNLEEEEIFEWSDGCYQISDLNED